MDTEAIPARAFGAAEAAMRAYMSDGERRALALGNRGPLRFEAGGALAPDILSAYARCGFYVFEGVLAPEELADIERDYLDIRDRLPTAPGAATDARGRPALARGNKAKCLYWSKPLGDPWGGTDIGGGRHRIEMTEPRAAAGAPREIVFLIVGSLQFSEACLRVYGHPRLLAVAAQLNGEDFVPFNEALFIKEPGLGASVSWHQDGQTHWNSPHLDAGTHGFNFMAQLYGSTPANGLWILPGSHRRGKVDIGALRAEGDADRIPGAVPLLCAPGDVAITSRQVVHGSFANAGPDPRVTVNFGFHRRSSVLNVETRSFENKPIVYDEARVAARSRVIGYAIDARRQRFPDETPFDYKPFRGRMEAYRWNDAARADLHDYNTTDLFI